VWIFLGHRTDLKVGRITTLLGFGPRRLTWLLLLTSVYYNMTVAGDKALLSLYNRRLERIGEGRASFIIARPRTTYDTE